jgi:hypothetical protein
LGYQALGSCCNFSETTPHRKDSINSKMVDPTSQDAASILLCFQKWRLNFSSPMATVSVPQCQGHFCVCDSRRVKSVLNSGKLPRIDWRSTKRAFEHNRSQLLHWPTSSLFLDTSSGSNFACQAMDLYLAMFSGTRCLSGARGTSSLFLYFSSKYLPPNLLAGIGGLQCGHKCK